MRPVQSVELGSFLSALLGAVAALGGVVITQRSQRKNAHADRIWKERTAAYGALYEMLEADLRILRRDDITVLPEGARDALDTPLPGDAWRQVFLFGSNAVLAGYRQYDDAIADVLLAEQIGRPILPALAAARTRGERLQQLISSETRGEKG
jgi:hypothetical protein